jgi:predicted permease
MFWQTFLKARLHALFQKRHFEREMDDEIRFHLELMVKNNIQSGMTPDEARHAARLAFGGIDQIKERCRDTRWTQWLDQLWQDMRYVLRMLSRNPISALITIILIAATIGMLCAAYAVLDAVLIRTLPVPHPEQLVVINPITLVDGSIYEVLQRERQNISQIFGMKTLVAFGNAGNAARSISICVIKGDFFGAMGAIPQMGRFLKADEQEMVAVISDRLWRREFAGVPDVLGRRIRFGSLAYTIVGIARPDFLLVEEPYSDWDAILPCDAFARSQGSAHWSPFQVIARLKANKKAADYEAQLNSLWPALLQATIPPKMTIDQWRKMAGSRAQVVSIPRGINYVLILNQSIPTAIHMTFGLSILIFLSGCLALVLLAIARSIKNQRQLAIQSAIGGGRWRVQRPFFLETLVLSVLGCSLGLMIALWWSGLGTSFLPSDEFIDWHVRIDRHVITLAFFMTLFFVAITSSVASLFGFRSLSSRILHSGAPKSRPNVRARTMLLAMQLAISVLLVHYALFFTSSFSRLLRIPFGFDPDNLHVYSLLTKSPDHKLPANYFPALISQIEQLDEVESAAITTGRLPADWPIEFKQPVRTDDGREVQATVVPVSPRYFRTLNLPLLLGKDFSWNDRSTAIVSEALAKRLYPDRDSLRHTIAYGKSGSPLQIIGVSGDMTYFGPRNGISSMVFVPCADELKSLPSGPSIMVRSKRNLEELKQTIQTNLDPLGAYYISRSVDQKTYLSSSMKEERILATIAGVLGGLIILLAGVELYAFCNYLQIMRTKELAIRASVGAGSAQIAITLLKEIAKALGIGLAIALVAILAGERVILSQAGFIHPPGFAYLILAMVIVAGATMSAVLMPTIQALRINLANTLRVD